MHRSRFGQLQREESPVGEDVAAQWLRWQGNWEDVGEDVLDGMCVLCCQSDGCCEAVVLLVDPCVERPGVEEAVDVVEEDLADEET